MNRARRNSFVVISIVHKDCTEVSHEVYYEEDGAFLRSHRHITTMRVAGNWVFLCSSRQEIVDFGGTSKLRTRCVGYLKVNRPSQGQFQNIITCKCLDSKVSMDH